MKKFTENLERKEKKIFFVLTMIPVSYTHLTLPTIA